MKQRLKKYLGFTIIELLTVVIILGMIIPSMITIYTFMIKSNQEFNFRQMSIQQGYEFFEKLNILMQDYTVDYEEYYNRQMVGCVKSGSTLLTGNNFMWNIGLSGYCTEFTAYGNENSTNRKIPFSSIISGSFHDIYYCDDRNIPIQGGGGLRVVVDKKTCGKYGSKQSFGQYKALFKDVDENIVSNAFEDRDLGRPVNSDINAIADANNIQELYLISHDGKNRLFFRRKLVAQSSGFVQYKIQMLRLRGFDAGQKHNFESSNNEGLYDGQIDTWACDTSMGFIGRGDSISGAYSDYCLPKDVDDCWVDLTQGSTSVYTWNLSISPLNDPDLYWAEQSRQINPYMKILVVNGIYLPTSNSDDSINSFKIPIETTINMKDFYKE